MRHLFPLVLAFAAAPAPAQAPATLPRLSDVQYEVSFNRETAGERYAKVSMTFTATTDPVILSLPAWTPGAYEISNFARWISGFSATAGGRPLTWDKVDFDTWRIRRAGASGPVTVSFDYRADTLDNAMAWTRPDFLMLNGTNVFMYPEGGSPDFSARVVVRTEPDWKIATGMARVAGAPGMTYAASNYHDLVDMPFFVGSFDLDSTEISGKWMRFATYPAGSITGAVRQRTWDQLRRATPAMVAVFGETPWDTYTVMQIVDSSYQGASGLEHSNSHIDVLTPPAVGSDFLPSLYAHEIFHAWNVKRLRPSELWPYRYDAPMPTTWLWVSEGITDYYADLALARGGVIDENGFYGLTSGKINEVAAVPPIALEDASLNTWVHPVDGTGYIYYPKGSLAGLMLDIMIRDASDNRRSLDDVLRGLYTTIYKQGRGFTRDDWWKAVSVAAGGRNFADFERKYIDGREDYPWVELLPLAGMRVEEMRMPRLGVSTIQDPNGVRIDALDPEGAAAAAGMKPGDYLLAINDLSVQDQSFVMRFREMFANAREGQPITLKVRRGAEALALTGALRLTSGGVAIKADPNAPAKAVRIRNGILRGTTDR